MVQPYIVRGEGNKSRDGIMHDRNWSGGEERLYLTTVTFKENHAKIQHQGLLQQSIETGMNLLYAQYMICDHFLSFNFDFNHNLAAILHACTIEMLDASR